MAETNSSQVDLVLPPAAHMRPSFAAKFEQGKLTELVRSIQTGRDLYDFHVYHVICKLLGQSGDDTATENMATAIWEDLLPDVERVKWVKWLQVMRDQCKSGNPAALYKLGLCGSLDGEEDLSTMAKEQIMDHLDLPAQHDSKKDGCRREKSNDGNLLILDALVPAMQRKQDRQSLYTQILTELKKYSTSNGSYCKARTHDGRRIHYDPDAKGPFGVSHKLQEVMAMSDRLWDIEVLLRPFGHMHKKLLCQRFTKYMLSLVKDFAPRPRFQAVWKYFGDLRERIVPISKSNSQETVRIVVEHTRQRCKDLHPECLLLKKAMNTGSEEVDIYSLHTETEGLGAQIGACFLGPKRSAGQYEELIERRLYTFLVSHPYAVNPRRKIPSQMQDKDVLKAKGGHGMKTRSMKRKASAIVETGSQAMEIREHGTADR